jgi:hypothetical protein
MRASRARCYQGHVCRSAGKPPPGGLQHCLFPEINRLCQDLQILPHRVKMVPELSHSLHDGASQMIATGQELFLPLYLDWVGRLSAGMHAPSMHSSTKG